MFSLKKIILQNLVDLPKTLFIGEEGGNLKVVVDG